MPGFIFERSLMFDDNIFWADQLPLEEEGAVIEGMSLEGDQLVECDLKDTGLQDGRMDPTFVAILRRREERLPLLNTIPPQAERAKNVLGIILRRVGGVDSNPLMWLSTSPEGGGFSPLLLNGHRFSKVLVSIATTGR